MIEDLIFKIDDCRTFILSYCLSATNLEKLCREQARTCNWREHGAAQNPFDEREAQVVGDAQLYRFVAPDVGGCFKLSRMILAGGGVQEYQC
ncbi:MAG: hypothetical protein LUO89_03225 [Methanothrix sp.]|nr:hypothetical protein [Methanothrix sp.]